MFSGKIQVHFIAVSYCSFLLLIRTTNLTETYYLLHHLRLDYTLGLDYTVLLYIVWKLLSMRLPITNKSLGYFFKV